VLLVTRGGAASSPPADEAAKLVPANALVYVHLSTDTDREATKAALELARRFPSFGRLRSTLLRRLQDPRCGTDLGRQHGKEAALALLDTNTGTAGSLVLVDTGKEHAEPETKGCGLVSQTYIGRFLAIGQRASLDAARALAKAGGKAHSLARNPDFVKAMSGLPDDRVADAWASADGVRRLLAPQGGLLGAAGVLLDQPGLKGLGAGLAADDEGARLVVRSELEHERAAPAFKPFEPTLQDHAPKGVLGYLAVNGLSSALRRVLPAVGPQSAGLDVLVGRVGSQLDRVLQGEAALTLTPAVPAPVLTVLAHAGKDTARTLAQLEPPIARLLGKQARFADVSVAGKRARTLRGAPITLTYAVVDDLVVISTAPSGIEGVVRGGDSLGDEDAFETVAGDAPGRVSSLLFLDFTELLRLGEQTGLGDSRAYQSVKDDLQKVRAVGVWSSGSGDESNAEIHLSIP
jgi:hypothetical protein